MMPIVISRLLTVSRDISVFSLFESLLPITAKEPSTFLPLTQQPAVHIELGMTIFGSFEVRFGVPGGLNAFTLFPLLYLCMSEMPVSRYRSHCSYYTCSEHSSLSFFHMQPIVLS